MKHEPDDFPRAARRAADAAADRRLDALLAALPPCPGIATTDEDVTDMIARSEADIAAGRVHDHAIVSEWLKTFSDNDYRPFHEWLAARNG